MQRLITCVLVLVFVSNYLCIVGTGNTVYNVMNYGAKGDGNSDDSKAFSSAWQEACGKEGAPTIVIPANGLFLVKNVILKGPCKATSIQITLQGNIIAPSKEAWTKDLDVEDNSSLISFTEVNNLIIDGTGGLIDGHGSTWWNCENCVRPKIISFDYCNDLSVTKLTITNSPRAHISAHGCHSAIFSHINISAPADTPNTDGFDISYSTNVLINHSTIQTGDDCIAINGGCTSINVIGIACGPGHGISLGRSNADDKVEGVYVRNCTFTNTKNGARIKTFSGGSGYARNITFEDIILKDTSNPIIINQHYHSLSNEGIVVSDVTYRRFQGTSEDDKAVNLECSSSGCFNIVLDQIDIVSSSQGKPASCYCNNVHGTITSTNLTCSCLKP